MKHYSGLGWGLLFLASCGSGAPPLGPPHAPNANETSAAAVFESTLETQSNAITATMLDPSSQASLNSMPASAAMAIKMGTAASPITLPVEEMLAQAGFQTCATVEMHKITYTDCDFNSGISGQGKLNGYVQRAGETISWSLAVVIGGVQFPMQGSTNYTWNGQGSMTITASAVKGSADLNATLAQYRMTHHMDIDVIYQKSPFCVTGGTMYVERHGPYLDGAARLTWTGCKMLTVEN